MDFSGLINILGVVSPFKLRCYILHLPQVALIHTQRFCALKHRLVGNFSPANCVACDNIRTPWAKGASEKINKKMVQIKDVYGGGIALNQGIH